MSNLRPQLEKAINEKDVENAYRGEIIRIVDNSQIVSPYGVDGLLETKSIRSLLEFKYKEQLKNKLTQCNILIQCLYYLKKFEDAGDKLPSTIFVGDINECFALHTNNIVKYLSSEIDWKIAPSEAHKKNPDLIQAMVNDVNILPFVFDLTDKFSLKTVIDKIRDFSDNVIRKVRVTKHNIVSIFDYFDKNVLGKVNLTTNEKANLFIQIVTNPGENYLHPKKKNILSTKSFGDLAVNQNLFNSFFSHFEGDVYSPKEKENLTALVDRLVEDSVRRNKGEFFTPTPFVDLAHKYVSDTFGEDWKERYIVWDCAWGTGNLTRDYKFKELYASTFEQSDIDTANQMGYNPEAIKFQFDFLNDGDEKLPKELREVIECGREILFLINPPYARSGENGGINKVQKGSSDTIIGSEMKSDNWGGCSANLYAQFLYRIHEYQQKNKNVKIGIFCPPLFLSGGSYKKFREKFFLKFGFEKGFLFEACHFSDVAKNWGISFTIFGNKLNENKLKMDLIDYNSEFELDVINSKEFYNTDNLKSLTDFLGKNEKPLDYPKLTTALNVKDSKFGSGLPLNSFGTFLNSGNKIEENSSDVYLLSAGETRGKGKSFIFSENLFNINIAFTARKSIQPTWINCKDEYLAPNEHHPSYQQFTYDSIVYSLFNNSSQQSSLRQITYKDKLWDIKNEFFWLSKSEMQALAEQNNYDELYRDAKNQEDRFVYKKLFGEENIYNKLSEDARDVLDKASLLLRKSISLRKTISEEHPEYHLNSFDAGYAQLKLVWKEYFKDEFKEFRDSYKRLEDRMRPLVYELGFLKK